MADGTVTIADLRDRVDRFVRDRDWKGYHAPKDLAIALSVEAAELLERFLWRPGPAPDAPLSAEDRKAVGEELADVMIYGLHLANALDLDLSDAILRKVAKNEAKYPADRFKGRAFETAPGSPR